MTMITKSEEVKALNRKKTLRIVMLMVLVDILLGVGIGAYVLLK
jgi:flagellar basal body-associated protein FliL